MHIDLTYSALDVRVAFHLKFFNDGRERELCPVEAIWRSGAKRGLKFRDGVGLLEPIEFSIVHPRAVGDGVQLQPGEAHQLNLEGSLDRHGNAIGLALPNATFKVALGKTYAVRFEWGVWRSNELQCSWA